MLRSNVLLNHHTSRKRVLESSLSPKKLRDTEKALHLVKCNESGNYFNESRLRRRGSNVYEIMQHVSTRHGLFYVGIILIVLLVRHYSTQITNSSIVSSNKNVVIEPFYITSTLATLNETLEDYIVDTRTGSFQNCSKSMSRRLLDRLWFESRDILSNVVYVSCHPVHYRIPLDALERAAQAQTDIIIGILSNGGGDGPMRRQTIRHTWASIEGTSSSSSSSSPIKDSIIQNIQNTTRTVSTVSNDKSPSPQLILSRPGIFFLVAGPWDSKLSKEFLTHRDLIWIDEREVYDAETSVLTYKTQSFASIIHKEMKRFPGYQYTYLFKTDDDSYLSIEQLQFELMERERSIPLYPLSESFMWGFCRPLQLKPLRDPKDKWSISPDLYPEEFYPRYCQGAGFALSRTLVQSAVDDGHIAEMRFMPFEDVSMGMVAERCRVNLFVHAYEYIQLYRTRWPWGTTDERNRVNLNLGRLPDGEWLPPADMKNKIIQHRVNSDSDMIDHFISELYNNY